MKRPTTGLLFIFALLVPVLAQTAGATSDPLLSVTDSEDSTRVGHTYSYLITVTNAGPDDVVDAEVVDILPDKVTFVDCSVSQGSWTQELGVVTCDLGAMAAGATAGVEIVVQAVEEGVATNQATVNGDTESGNNRATETTTIDPENRSPTISLPGPHTLVVGACTTFVVTATDADHDPVTLTCTKKPSGASFDGTHFSWCAGVDDCGTTNEVEFVADDCQGETNSVVTNTTWITVPFDNDSDTLSDAWEWENFGEYSWDASDDPDGDGMINYAEYVAGTQPTNDSSSLRVKGERQESGVDSLVIRWGGVSGRYYAVLRSSTGPEPDNMTMVASNIAATPPENVYTDAVGSAWQVYYYRILVRTNQW